MTSKTTPDPVKTLADATRQRAATAESLPGLREQAQRADSLDRPEQRFDTRTRDGFAGSENRERIRYEQKPLTKLDDFCKVFP